MTVLIKEIENINAKGLQDILGEIHKLAKSYRELETETFSLVSQVRMVGENVNITADFAKQKRLKPCDAFASMYDDFGSLSKHLEKVTQRHEEIANNMKNVADDAKMAKDENDKLVMECKQLRDDAEIYGVMTIPGASLVACTAAGAMSASELVDNKILKVPVGALGFVAGLAAGAITTILIPVFAIMGARCAILGSRYSKTFDDISNEVIRVEQTISSAKNRLACITGILKHLAYNVSKNKDEKPLESIILQFEHIRKTCTTLIQECEHFLDNRSVQ